MTTAARFVSEPSSPQDGHIIPGRNVRREHAVPSPTTTVQQQRADTTCRDSEYGIDSALLITNVNFDGGKKMVTSIARKTYSYKQYH